MSDTPSDNSTEQSHLRRQITGTQLFWSVLLILNLGLLLRNVSAQSMPLTIISVIGVIASAACLIDTRR